LRKTSLRTVLKRIGFRFKKFNGRVVVMERTDIVAWRARFLREFKKRDPKSMIFLDETWVNANQHVNRIWTDGTKASTPKLPVGKGGRIIVLDAGNWKGFIPNCLMIFR
jgi:hypothetical protein